MEVQEDKILSTLILLLSVVLGISYIATTILLIMILCYSLYKGYNLKFKKMYLLFLFNIPICVYYRNYLGILVDIALIAFFYISYIRNRIDYNLVVRYSAYMAVVEIVLSLLLRERAGVYSFFNPNYYGAFLALLIVYYHIKKYDRKYLLVFIIALLLTGSRFALVSLILTYALVLLDKNRVLGSIALIISLIYFYLVYKGIVPFVRADTISKYLDLRLWIYQLGIKGMSHGFLLGHGPTYFYEYSKHVYPHSHNILIEYILSYGLIGLVYALYNISEVKFNKKKILVIALIMIHGLADYTIFWPQVALVFLTLF
ncbi:O-antigen ligase family protein [Sneathia sp. DSM 16631]|uniref:O-antigen ligase family protein n=1 Tax=Sneathia TaxID=168808 RepID=UPI00186807A9|nr:MULTISPECIES: O-antigen ligase family protein [Sneathia]MBE3031281.1 O-antigen ligase family protein [Sneathia sp. DSM 16631]MDK9582274.1 O-antigen ligase family protein [Sneathia vaginalis]